jgi:4-amino-4-deoxy-L-arabinose transferase-like glycosyltransferase
MQYTITMTSRMLAIAALCAFLLCVLLFLLGIELGKRFGEPAAPAAAVLPAVPAAPSVPAAPQVPAVAAPAAKP